MFHSLPFSTTLFIHTKSEGLHVKWGLFLCNTIQIIFYLYKNLHTTHWVFFMCSKTFNFISTKNQKDIYINSGYEDKYDQM
ncbi:hypothetical protein CN489_30185 [Bacillus cereus]|nr:hypothetical protein CN489_30185 [Bacillus cereus]